MDFPDILDENSPPKKCTKSHCKTLIPASSKYKQCQSCRERQQGLSRQYRARQKASAAVGVSAGSKRARDGGKASEGRPAKRARPGEHERTSENTESDDDDDLFGSFETTVCINFHINQIIINWSLP